MLDTHPLAEPIPAMTEEEYTALVEDIAQHGLREAVVMYEGMILDGKHRYRALRELTDKGLEVQCPDPLLVPFEGTDDQARAYVESMNIHRRHLKPTQLACKGILWIEEQKAKGEFKQGRREKAATTGGFSGDARDVAAVRFGVAHSMIDSARHIRTEAPDLFEHMHEGGMTAYEAEREVKDRERRERREQMVETGLSALPESLADRCTLIESCVVELPKHVEPESVDVIVTDPPYGQDELQRYTELGQCAQVLLKPGGSLFCMCGQSYLPRVLHLLSDYLAYQWIVAYLTPGGQSAQLWQRKVNTFWKPVLWFAKGPYEGEWQGDVVQSVANDKRFHDCGQSESGIGDLIDKYTTPGDLVLDPFLGGGTTALCALRLDRRFTGADEDPEAVAITRARIAKEVERERA